MYACQKVTFPVAGIIKLITPFVPTKIRLTVGKIDTENSFSSGEATDVTAQRAETTHFDIVPTGETVGDTTRCLLHRQRQSNGSLPIVLAIDFRHFGSNGVAKRAVLNVDTPNADTNVVVEYFA